MDSLKYIDMISERLKTFFDLEKEKIISGMKFELFASCHAKHVRTFLTLKDVIDSYETNEYYAIKVFRKKFSEEDLFLFDEFLKNVHKIYVTPKEDHMCSIINGVAVLEDGIEEKVEKKIRSYSYEKSYLFLLKGWSRINIAAVDLKNNRVITSRWGKKLEKFLKPKIEEKHKF